MSAAAWSAAALAALFALWTRQQARSTAAASPSNSDAPTHGQASAHATPTHDIMIRAARGEHTERAPVWAMRQAGRYLPEFMAARAATDFFTRVRTPTIAAELTLQPLLRFPSLLDAVVIFSDILIVPQAMGCEVVMAPGKGPVLPRPIAEPADIDRLTLRPNAAVEFSYLTEAIRLTRARVHALAHLDAAAVEAAGVAVDAATLEKLRGREVPIIGFAGGPWTLVSYMIEGGGAKDFSHSKTFLLRHPAAAHKLLSAVTDVVIDLLTAQAHAGASLLQVFESHGGELPPRMFNEFALPYLLRIAKQVRAALGPASSAVPLIVFPRNAHHAIDVLAVSDYDVIGLDWAIDPTDAVHRVRTAAVTARMPAKALQGNLDPAVLFAAPETIQEHTRTMLHGFGDHPLIANLGHGMLPSHKPEALMAYFAAVHEESSRMRS